MPLSQNTALFSLLGTTYGGDGKSTFALPNLQGSAPMHPGQGPGLSLHDLGEAGGSETVSLLESEIPVHTPCLPGQQHHRRRRDSDGQQCRPDGVQCLSDHDQCQPDANGDSGASPAGGSQPHNNMQPYLTLNFCIALQGVFPPRG